MSEAEKIQHLLRYIEDSGATFVRNNDEHNAKEAADHLRLKLRRAGSRVKTAREFIDHLASASSFSGKAYTIRLKNGGEVSAGKWLHEELARLEAGNERPK